MSTILMANILMNNQWLNKNQPISTHSLTLTRQSTITNPCNRQAPVTTIWGYTMGQLVVDPCNRPILTVEPCVAVVQDG